MTDHNWHYSTGEKSLIGCWIFALIVFCLVFAGFIALLIEVL